MDEVHLQTTQRPRPYTGGVLMVAGPDGAGKSTLTDELLGGVLAGKPVLRIHHRPRVLPGREPSPEALIDPHRSAPYAGWLSWLKAVYLSLDYLLGWAIRVRPVVRAGGWVIIERGWWDILVDPRRYRLGGSAGLLHYLSKLVPRPDLVLVLEAPVAALRARKTELAEQELARQMRAWRTQLPGGVRRQYLDASRPMAEVVRLAEAEVRASANRAEAEVHASLAGRQPTTGWVNLPGASSPRWIVPRAPRAAAGNALRLYQPVTWRGLAGWSAARLVASLGGFRLLARGRAPSPEWSILAPHIPHDSLLGVMRSTHPGRSVAVVLSPSGEIRAVAKVATDERSRPSLAIEADALQRLASLLPPPLSAPGVIALGEGYLLLEAAAWQPRLKPWRLPAEVARALGQFFRARATAAESGAIGLVHGDCAPWNLLRTRHGWMLVDWEYASLQGSPFHDVFHYLVQSHALLGHPSSQSLLAGLHGKGWIGETIRRFAEGAEISVDGARASFITYLEQSRSRLLPGSHGYTQGVLARERLREVLGASATMGGHGHQ